MTDEVTQAPRIDGEFWVFADGRRLPRVRGAEEPPAATEDTPAENAAPADGTPAPDDPEYTPERARGLHAELTKVQQEAAAFRQLQERARRGDSEALRELTGFDFAEDDSEVPDPDDEPETPRDPRVDQLLQEREAEQARAFVTGVSGHIGDLLKDAKVELPKPLADGILPAVFAAAGDGPLQESTTEQVVKQWTQAITDIKKQAVQDFIKSKTDAPYVAPGGTGATDEVLPLDASRSERQRWMSERYSLGQQP